MWAFLLLPAVLWLGCVSVGDGCKGSMAAGWWPDGKQRQNISVVRNLCLSTRAEVPRPQIYYYCLASNRVLGGSHSPFCAPSVSVLGLNWAPED